MGRQNTCTIDAVALSVRVGCLLFASLSALACGGSHLGSAPLPPDPWMDAERDLYQGILARQKADLLVVPFQTQGYGLDRIERQT